ncbi:hypothetical protein ACW7BJ_03640 [Azospirillum argentinense]|nr:hypothetical protein [Azospirillum argentinense]
MDDSYSDRGYSGQLWAMAVPVREEQGILATLNIWLWVTLSGAVDVATDWTERLNTPLAGWFRQGSSTATRARATRARKRRPSPKLSVTHVRHFLSGFLLQETDDLLLAEPAASHASVWCK